MRGAATVRALLATVMLLPALAVAGAGAEQFQVLELVRTRRTAARELTFTVGFHTTHPRGFYGVFALATNGGGTALRSAATVEHGAPDPKVYGAPDAGPRPPATIAPGGVYLHSLPVAGTRVFVVSEAATLDIDVPREWTVRRARLTVHRLLDEDVSVGARTPVYGAEVFQGPVTLPGGRYGSVAWAGIPCAEIPYRDPVVGAGAGSATLDGGARPVPLHCLDNSVMTSYPRRTTWTLRGSVQGFSDVMTRLFVLDFPKP